MEVSGSQQEGTLLAITAQLLHDLHTHVEAAYPGEGAGFLLGNDGGSRRTVTALVKLENAREEKARSNRFLLTPGDYAFGEDEADRLGLTLLGVFHSHPDCPNVPSEYDREWAMPWFSYIITRVDDCKAVSDRSWRLLEDRGAYEEEKLVIG
ncbi:MAG: M67 family metallopeptidase [Chloroflexota bacterium]